MRCANNATHFILYFLPLDTQVQHRSVRVITFAYKYKYITNTTIREVCEETAITKRSQWQVYALTSHESENNLSSQTTKNANWWKIKFSNKGMNHVAWLWLRDEHDVQKVVKYPVIKFDIDRLETTIIRFLFYYTNPHISLCYTF